MKSSTTRHWIEQYICTCVDSSQYHTLYNPAYRRLNNQVSRRVEHLDSGRSVDCRIIRRLLLFYLSLKAKIAGCLELETTID